MSEEIITFHVFEMWIGMNEFHHRILALLEQQRERPEKNASFKFTYSRTHFKHMENSCIYYNT